MTIAIRITNHRRYQPGLPSTANHSSEEVGQVSLLLSGQLGDFHDWHNPNGNRHACQQHTISGPTHSGGRDRTFQVPVVLCSIFVSLGIGIRSAHL